MLFYLLSITTLSIVENLDKFKFYLKQNNLQKAKEIIENLYKNGKNNKIVKEKYGNFLLENGEFEKIENELLNKELKKKINEIRNLRKNKKQNIDKLLLICPYFLDFRISKIDYLLEKNELKKLENFFKQTETLFKNNSKIIEKKIILFANKFNHENVKKNLKILKNKNFKLYEEISQEFEKLKKKINSENLKKLIKKIDNFKKEEKFKIFKPIFIKSLFLFLKHAIENKKNCSEFGQILYDVNKNDDQSKYLFVRSLILEKKYKEAENIIKEIKDQKIKNNLNILLKEAQNSEKKKETEKKEEFSSARDPLGYYKILDVSPGSSEEEIKKAYRKKLKENNPRSQKKKLSEEEEKKMNQKLAKINQAKDVLLNGQKRKSYDNGTMTDGQYSHEGQRHANQNYGHNQHYGGHQVHDVFEALFGGGQNSNRGFQYFFDMGDGQRMRQRQSRSFVFM